MAGVIGNRGGRPAKPTAMHLVDGTYKKHRHAKRAEPDYGKRLPPVPSHLDTTAKGIYRKIGKLLLSKGVITEADAGILALYAQSYSHWIDSEVEIAKEKAQQALIDEIYEKYEDLEDGEPWEVEIAALAKRVRRLERTAKFETAAMKRSQNERLLMEKFGSRLGLSPTDRTRVRAEAPKETSTPMSELLSGSSR